MKNLKKIGAIALAMVLALALCAPAFAASHSTDTDNAFSITITKNDGQKVSFKDTMFKAYKIFDVTYSEVSADGNGGNYSYTVTPAFENLEFDGATGQEIVDKLSNDNKDSFIQAVQAYITANSIEATQTVEVVNEVESVEIPLTKDDQTCPNGGPGYYIVIGNVKGSDETQAGSVNTVVLDTTNPSVSVTVKNEVPAIDKKIVEDNTEKSENTAVVGQVLPFKVTTVVPNMTGYDRYYFYVTDTMSKGLTYIEDLGVTVKVDGEKIDPVDANVEVTNGVKYSLAVTKNTDGTTKLEIVFKNAIAMKAQAGKAIEITYYAEINENAVTGTDANTNEVILNYPTTPGENWTGENDNPDKPTDPTGTTPKSETKTYLTDIKLIKVDAKNPDTKLDGAEFTITGESTEMVSVWKEKFVEDGNGSYWKLTDGTYTETAPTVGGDADNTDKYVSIDQKYRKTDEYEVQEQSASVVVNKTLTTGADGTITFEGLGVGKYTITEIKAPDGYNMLKAPIVVTITATGLDDVITWSASSDLQPDGKDVVSMENNTVKMTVGNSTGTELPSTGGIGTTIFYVAGGVLVLGAVILLVTRKRVNGEV